MKIDGIGAGIVAILVIIGTGIAIATYTERDRRGRMNSPNAPAPEGEPVAGEPTPWTYLGEIPDAYYSSRVFRRRDPETGAWIYVMVGQQGRGGIFVLPGEVKK